MMNVFANIVCVLLLLTSQQLFAQAVPKVVPIEQEPFHDIVFQNKNVRIVDCIIPPGEMTLFHTHTLDNFTVTVMGGKGTLERGGAAKSDRGIGG